MRYRTAAASVVGLVAITAAIATATANVGAGTGQRRGASTGATTTGVTTPSGPSTQLCNVAGGVEGLTVIRTDAFPQNGFTFAFPARVTVRPAAARHVAEILCALQPVPQGAVFYCPADFGIVYHLVFTFETGAAVRPVTVDATGCQFVNGAGPGERTLFTTGSFWAVLGRAMGLVHPTEATFRGSHAQS
jgi:hypothetical protein